MKDLTPLLEPKGLVLRVLEDLDHVTALGRTRPSVLVLDLAAVGGLDSLAELVARLSPDADVPAAVLCLASRERGEGTLAWRLAALRAGVDSYQVMPVTQRRLAERILRLSGHLESRRYRVLVVEPQPDQSKKIAITIASAGMEVLVVEDPMKLLDRLQAFRPNLVLISQDIPRVGASELAAVIRDHDDFFGLPILFLSSDPDPVGQLEALKAGGDGFVLKPVQRHQLIAAIEQRVRESRWFRNRRTLENRRESARGFLPRAVFMAYLDRFLDARELGRDGLGLLVLELDQHARALERLGIGGYERLLGLMEAQISGLMSPEEAATRLDECRYALLASRERVSGLQSLAAGLCARLSEGLGTPDGSKQIGLTVSIGIGVPTPPLEDASTLLSRANQALTWAREAGGNQARLWTQSVVERAEVAIGHGMIRRLVNAALNHDGLVLLFQPVAPVARQGEELYEALLRLNTLDGEQISPTDFLASAERGGLMVRIDRWVLGHALEVMDRHRTSHPHMRFLVHQTVGTLAAPEWFPWFREQIVQRNLIRLYPVLQFQLADVRQNRLEAKPLMDRLKTYGIQCCVANVVGSRDDLTLLSKLGVRYVKLSMQILTQVEQVELMGIVQGLQERGIAVIATGIDDKERLAQVWSCRPDFIQGDYIEPPGEQLSFDFKRTAGGS
ncbi:EAL domain-containing protein [Imhoffiella purpurea]|uniref:EAL domain-containing protein n=1 Tax=Imhoffiella purpurea TaxID=1249627 RepID=UPI001E3B00C5|nr:EAL domain-containing protein [Imhoffiella purpurea]